MTNNQSHTPLRIIRRDELRDRVGYSHVHIWRLEREGKFPKRVKLGPQSVGWLEHEVEAWIRDRMEERK